MGNVKWIICYYSYWKMPNCKKYRKRAKKWYNGCEKRIKYAIFGPRKLYLVLELACKPSSVPF